MQGRYNEAEALYKNTIQTFGEAFGQLPASRVHRRNLAFFLMHAGDTVQAVPLLNRAIASEEAAFTSPGSRRSLHTVKAVMLWNDGRRADAVAELQEALDFAEEERGNASGASLERAALFADAASAFELMVSWQSTLNNAVLVCRPSRGRTHARCWTISGSPVPTWTQAYPRTSQRRSKAGWPI